MNWMEFHVTTCWCLITICYLVSLSDIASLTQSENKITTPQKLHFISNWTCSVLLNYGELVWINSILHLHYHITTLNFSNLRIRYKRFIILQRFMSGRQKSNPLYFNSSLIHMSEKMFFFYWPQSIARALQKLCFYKNSFLHIMHNLALEKK